MAQVIVRDLDQTVVDRINELAEKKGLKREEYLRRVLKSLAVSGELRELDSKYESLVNLLMDQAKMMNDVIDKNTYTLEKNMNMFRLMGVKDE